MGARFRDSSADDARLLAAIGGGDETAYAALYDRYSPILFALLLRILGDRSEAEDLLQDVFLQVWQRAGDYDANRGRPFSWLTLLARSRALDRLRRTGLGSRVQSTAGREVQGPPNPADAAADSEEAREVRRALGSLPETQREALFLAYFEGLSQSEIAVRLGRPLGTVKTHTRAALLRLRELIRK